MAALVNRLIPFDLYNSLPTIKDVSNVPADHSQDIEDVRKLLVKHGVAQKVSIRLIHKHFDAKKGEVMVFNKAVLSGYGTVQTMKPVVPPNDHKLHGIHYFLNEDGDAFLAYEYVRSDIPDVILCEPFLEEFCGLVTERSLQRKLGLKIKMHDDDDDDKKETGWTEFEYPQGRSTIMFEDGMPTPKGDFGYTVSTEWGAPGNEDGKTNCKHKTTCNHGQKKCTHCKHCTHCAHAPTEVAQAGCGGCGGGDGGHNGGVCLGGQNFPPGTPIHNIVKQAFSLSVF